MLNSDWLSTTGRPVVFCSFVNWQRTLFFRGGFRSRSPLTHPTSSSHKKMFAVAANTTVRAVAQVKATKVAAKEQKSS